MYSALDGKIRLDIEDSASPQNDNTGRIDGKLIRTATVAANESAILTLGGSCSGSHLSTNTFHVDCKVDVLWCVCLLFHDVLLIV
jgi:hypothetical protein